MNDSKPDGNDLVMTQAELPPGIDAPAPPVSQAAGSGENSPADVVREVRQLADRVGGMAALKALVDELASAAR